MSIHCIMTRGWPCQFGIPPRQLVCVGVCADASNELIVTTPSNSIIGWIIIIIV